MTERGPRGQVRHITHSVQAARAEADEPALRHSRHVGLAVRETFVREPDAANVLAPRPPQRRTHPPPRPQRCDPQPAAPRLRLRHSARTTQQVIVLEAGVELSQDALDFFRAAAEVARARRPPPSCAAPPPDPPSGRANLQRVTALGAGSGA